MKKIYLLAASFMAAALSFGQINLSYESPITHPFSGAGITEVGSTDGWGLGIFEASTDATDGTTSAKLTTATNPNFALAGLPTTLSGETIQSVTGSFSNNGADISGSVDFKYAPESGDSAIIIFEVYDTLTAGTSDDVLLYSGSLLLTLPVGSWTTIPLTLQATGNTGTANQLIFGGMSSYRAKTVGSTLMLDSWVIDLGGSLGIENNKNVSFKVFPNPATDVLNISSSEEVSNVSILSLDGKLVSTTSGKQVDVSNLKTGVYIYEVTMVSGEKVINKFMKK